MTVGRVDTQYIEFLGDTAGFATVEDDQPSEDGVRKVYALVPILPGAEEKAMALAEMIAQYLTPAGKTEVV